MRSVSLIASALIDRHVTEIVTVSARRLSLAALDRVGGLCRLEAAVRVEVVASAAPNDRVAEKAGYPEYPAQDVLHRQKMPADRLA